MVAILLIVIIVLLIVVLAKQVKVNKIADRFVSEFDIDIKHEAERPRNEKESS